MIDVFDVNGAPKLPETPENKDEIARLAYSLFFVNEEGKKFWQLFRKEMFEEPVAPLQYAASYARFREGQNSIFRLIEQRVEKFLKEQP